MDTAQEWPASPYPGPDSNLPGQALLGWPLPMACRLWPGPGHPSPSHTHTPFRQLILNSWGLGWRQLCAQGSAEGRTHMFSLQSSGAGRREKESRLNRWGDRQMGVSLFLLPPSPWPMGQRLAAHSGGTWAEEEHQTPLERRRGKRAGVLEGCRFGVAGDTTARGPGTRGL